MFALASTELELDIMNYEEMIAMIEDDDNSVDENLMFRKDCDTVTLQRVVEIFMRR